MPRPLDRRVDPKADYESRLVDASEAASLVRSGDLVLMPSSHQSPQILAALAAREDELERVTVRSVVIPNMGWFREDAAKAWDLQVQFALAPDNRAALGERLIDFHPFAMVSQHKATDHRPDEGRPIDVLILVVSPPDEHGFVCIGNACWDAVTSVARADRVLVEISPTTPRTCGDTTIHVSQIDAFVMGDRPRLGSPDPDRSSFGEVDRRIAANVKSLVRDGDTIQLGLGSHTGALPLLGAFDDANDLGFFSELTVPGTVALAERGIITSRHCEVHPGRFVASCMGNSLEDFDTIDGNPFYELHSYEHTNDPVVIARHEHMLTLNGALMVDLTGQIGVYAMGPHVYSGTGGQLAYHMGATLSKQGRAVTVIPSTAKGGTISCIVPSFEAGQIVSIPREFADTIVTDHGIARLFGKSVRERAEQLIAAAHPDHRDALEQEARRLYWP